MTEHVPTDAELKRPAASRLAVLGQPISHSKSPVIHTAAYAALDLSWEYEAIECGEQGLEALLASRGAEWRGFSLTMPLKEEARRIASVVDPVAEESGVVNTLLRLTSDTSGVSQWAGFNTDVAGLAAAISNAGLDATHTVVIGSGATAISAVLAARKLGAAKVTLLARNAEALSDLVTRFDGTSQQGSDTVLEVQAATFAGLAQEVGADGSPSQDVFAGSTLVISTLPGPASAALSLPVGAERTPLFDVAYDPWPSPLATRWRLAGGEAHAGLDMLIEQALVQIRIFVNGDPGAVLDDEDALRSVMRSASVER